MNSAKPHAVTKPNVDVFDEEVRGVVVGGDWISWKLYYGARCVQSTMKSSDTDEEALEEARRMIKDELAIAAILYPHRYNDATQWTIRVFNG